MRKFLNLNDEDSGAWTLEELRKLREDERTNGMYVYDDFEEWLDNKLQTDFEEIE